MIDLHSHILPGIDDGADSMEDALEMARIAVDGGTDVIVAASHGDFSVDDAGEYLEFYQKTLSEFRSELEKNRIPLRVLSGMELLVSEKLLRYAEEHSLPSLNGGAYLLVEFLFDISARRAKDWLGRLLEKGWKIVLAHPERYDFVRKNPAELYDLYDSGAVLQVNKGSLKGEFGRSAFRAADLMLREGIAGAVASDAHDPVLRTPDLYDAAEILDLHYGRDAAEILLERNPGRILGKRGM